MKGQTRTMLWIALAAGIAGALAAFVVHGPGPIWRTELGQRALQAVIAKPAPAGLEIAQRGAALPAIRVQTLEGLSVSLPLPAGRPALINVWATWCGPCIKEMPELDAYAQAQGADGVQVIGVALDDAQAVRSWLQQRPVRYPQYRDDAGPRDAGVALGNTAGALPYSILVDADGTVLRQRLGPFDSAAEIADWAHP